MSFDLAQTFFVDKKAISNSEIAYVTSIDLYFNKKPTVGKTASGLPEPGVGVYLTTCSDDGIPDINSARQFFLGYKSHANINVSTTGSTATNFKLANPFPVQPNKQYAFLVKCDGNDEDFQFWYNKAGGTVLGTTTTSQVSSGNVDGRLYLITNGDVLTPLTDSDLSFKLYVANFNTGSADFKIANRGYEFLNSYNIVGRFKGGEDVYQSRSALTGTVSINSSSNTLIGSGTSFNTQLTAGVKFVITDGTPGNTDVKEVASVTNATHVVLTTTPSFTAASGSYYKTVTGRLARADNDTDELVIEDSTANSTIYLTVNTTIIGVDSLATANISAINAISVAAFVPAYAISVPKGTDINIVMTLANSSYGVSNTNARTLAKGKREFFDNYPAIIASRSTEVTNNFVSSIGTLTFTSTNKYASPQAHKNNLDMLAERLVINNDITNEYQGTGSAKARYISKSLTLAEGQRAEDMKIYARVYRPSGTDIRVYARFRSAADSDSLSIKQWTEFTPTQANTLYSSFSNKQDFIELSFDLPFFPQDGVQQSGTFTGASSNAVLVGTSGAVNTGIVAGDLVRVYSAAIPNTYFIDTVTASNTTTLTLGSQVANVTFHTSGLRVDKIVRNQSGFLDVQSNNVLTYYNSTGAKFTTFKDYQIKIVMLSSDGVRVPYVEDIRAIAVSA